ncbi:MAG: hypothetical protein HYU69_12335 [Bacteroidetes bacterium]|nr:hypothetical protein [Bacteroidota bacterium]
MSTYQVINAKKTAPSVSILLPTHKSDPNHKIDKGELQAILKKTETQLFGDYPENTANLIMQKLNKIVEEIDYQHLSESIAIFVSKDNDVVLNLPFRVSEKLVIDNSFEIRDLVYAGKHSRYYTVLVISHNHNKLYYGFNDQLNEVKVNKMPLNADAVEIDHHSKVGNFSTADKLSEVNFEKYLRAIDHALTEETKIIDAPIIVLSVKKTNALFSKITHNGKKITGYVEGNFEHTSEPDIYKAIQPLLEQKEQSKQDEILKKLDAAIGKKTYVSGMENVWVAAREKRGQLLIVEKDYYCTARVEGNRLIIMENNAESLKPPTKDAVDDVIELVLASEGDIAFVDNGKLNVHERIALITYF